MSALRLAERIAFYEELRRMMSAGFVLSQAMKTLGAARGSRARAGVFEPLEASCAAGRPLADGMAALDGEFGSLEVNLVRAGESGGRLEEALKSLADYFRRRQEMLRRVWGALLYPVFLVHVGIFVPPLPLFVLSGWFAYIRAVFFGLLIVYGAAAVGWGFTRLVGRLPGLAEVWDRVRFSIPWYGPAAKRFAIARFATSLGHLLDAGVPTPKAIELSVETLAVPTWRGRILASVPRVRDGDRIASALGDAGFLPPSAAALLVAGEEAGQLPEVLADITRMSEDEGGHIARVGCKVLSILFLLVAIGFAGWQLLAQIILRFAGAADKLG